MTTDKPTQFLIETLLNRDFFAFFEKCFDTLHPGRSLVHAPYLDLLAALASEIAAGNTRFSSVALPPRHLKSQIFSIALPCWLLGKDPKLRLIVSSHNDTLAADLAAARMRILTAAWFKAAFCRFELRPDRMRTADFETIDGGGILSTTLRTGVSGRGADVIIVDDPIAVTDQYSTAAREHAVHVFQSELLNRVNDPKASRVIVVGHRVHVDDLIGHVRKQSGWTNLSMPFEATQDERIKIGGFEWSRSVGQLLAPDRYDVASVARVKADYREFQSLYQQRPEQVSAGYIRRDHFHRQTEPKVGDYVASWDLASTVTQTSSYSVALIFRRVRDTHHLVHAWRGRVEFRELKGVVGDLEQRFRPKIHLIENASLGAALAGELNEKGVVTELISPGSKSKLQRLDEVLSDITAKRVVLPETDISWVEDFLAEITSFPAGSHDDQVDALTQYLRWAQSNPGSPDKDRVVRVVGRTERQGRASGSLLSLLPKSLAHKITGRRPR